MLQQIDAHSQNGEFTGLKETLKNAKRILRPQGVMFITTMFPSHFTKSYWFTQLQHSISERMTPYFLPAEQYLSLFSECGFQCVSSLSLLRAHTPTLFVEYLDPEGPLKENFRIGTSMFGNSNNEELLELENKILNLKHKDLLKDYIKQHDRTPELGFVVLFACIPV